MSAEAKVIVILKSAPGAPELEKKKVGFKGSFTVQKMLAHLRKALSLPNETPLVKKIII